MKVYLKNILLVLFISSMLISCSSKIKSYSLRVLEYPEWIHTEFPGFAGSEKKLNMDYNNTNMFIWDTQTAGCNYSTLEVVIDPRLLPINCLYLKELSFFRDGKKIYLINDKEIKNPYNLKGIANLKFRDYPKYYGNMELDESIDVIVTIIYKIDDGLLIKEETPYKITCFEYVHNPNIILWIYNLWSYSAWAIYYLWILSIIIMITIYIKNNISNIFCNNILKSIPIIFILNSIVTFLSFSYVFIFNRGSNIAQLSETFYLWAFWYKMYEVLFFSNIFIIILFILSLILNKKIYKAKNKIYYVSLIINIILNIFHILSSIPDA
ncbi:MAG: hypothetical protein LBU88_00395 [Treponema sp.]|jgi:hypothetical protein|nr:hypothetical protein [Treponema sp.]